VLTAILCITANFLWSRQVSEKAFGFLLACCPSIVYTVVISWKLSKIDPYLLWNITRKFALLILLLHSDTSQTPRGAG